MSAVEGRAAIVLGPNTQPKPDPTSWSTICTNRSQCILLKKLRGMVRVISLSVRLRVVPPISQLIVSIMVLLLSLKKLIKPDFRLTLLIRQIGAILLGYFDGINITICFFKTLYTRSFSFKNTQFVCQMYLTNKLITQNS